MMAARWILLPFGWLVAHEVTASSRPPFVAHVTKDDLRDALALAKKQHTAAVQRALDNYPIPPIDAVQGIETTPLKEYTINAPGCLPDFADQLPRKIYVTDPPLLSKEECDQVIRDAEAYFAEHHNGEWTTQQSGQYEVAGFWIKDVPAVRDWFLRTLSQRLFPLMAHTFPDFVSSAAQLCVDNTYLFKYTPETGGRTDVHTDSGCLSFTIALNSNKEYQGGGTWFEGLEGGSPVLEMDQGQVTIRPGGVKHCGHAVESGVRYIIGGFCMNQQEPETIRQLATLPDTKALEAAVVLNPKCDVVYNLLANQYEQQGKTETARAVLEYCLHHVHPSAPECAYALGSMQRENGQFEDAKNNFEICLKVDEYDVDAMMGLANVYASLKDANREKECYDNLVANPAASKKVLGTAYTNLGVLAEGQDMEIEYYKKALDYSPESFAAWYSLGCAYASRQDWKPAVDALRRSIDVNADPSTDPNQVKALTSLYTATSRLLQTDTSRPAPTTQEEMVAMFEDLMGAENFQRVASMSR